MIQNSGYDRFPPIENDWGTIHLMPNMAPPLLAEEEGPPTYKELSTGVIHAIAFPCSR
jgi:hypothetical protein